MNEIKVQNERDDSRARNRKALESRGFDLFPASGFHPRDRVESLKSKYFVQEDQDFEDRPPVRIAGRLYSLRPIGRAWFADLRQAHERIQLYLSKSAVNEDIWFLVNHLDIGDIVGVEGTLFRTRRGELTVAVRSIDCLCKPSTTPPIGKTDRAGVTHEASSDTGSLLREHRHVKFMTDRNVFENIRHQATVKQVVREKLTEKGFLEVDTSILSRFYGGASATPFTTKSKALGVNLYGRVAPEGDLKRLLVGGFDQVFEIGPNFRNEGIDATHQPVFQALEVYQSYADYRDMMNLTEELVTACVKAVCGELRLRVNGRVFDFTPPWPRFQMLDLVALELGLAPDAVTYELMLEAWLQRCPGQDAPRTWGEILVAIFEEYSESQLLGPCFLLNHPLETSPLTKVCPEDSRLTERFEAYLGGIEFANAYSELNDPVEQRRRLQEQTIERDERYALDEWFLTAMDDGLPQAGGLGIGIDRLVMLLTGSSRISDVIAFPVS